ncbi:MAG: uracil-DNA glycosylase [Nitrosospira sp.]|nr:uracil-DNA glycosylase [Nitrosospira sp.]MDN5934952.1 uracil-DNA glycosylase [Nitrosospira sp.]
MRRREILNELGLTPLWRAKDAHTPDRLPAAQADPGEQGSGRRVDATEDRRSEILRMGWDQLKTSVEGCIACPLCRSRSRTVFGIGDRNADWLYVGEGPGVEEDAAGEPFVGPSGKLLDNMLAAIDLRRGRSVYIANIVKCRPPGNRNPASHEAQRCEPYLARQIELIKPKLIIALGKVAVQNLLHTDANLASLRGRVHEHAGIPVIVTYHPAYLLRTLQDKAKVWEDLCFARSTMQKLLQSAI